MSRLLASTAAVALLSTAAFAADLPLPVEPMEEVVAAPAYDWSGVYIGASGGFGWGDYDYIFTQVAGTPNVGNDLEGWVAGGQIGYNWQSGMFVLGAVADISWSDIEGNAACPNPAFTCNVDVEWFGTVRGNVGVALDRFLIYGTGGFAYGGIERQSAGGGAAITQDETHIGWAAGGGIGFGVTNNLTIGAEALFVNLDNETYAAVPPLFSQVDIGADFVVVRGSANFKFGAVAP
ncbi:MAG: outer membrane protein [Propylenella sp.]